MLAFRREDGAPVALLPGRFGRYRMVDPTSGRAQPVDAGRAASLHSNAIFFYQSLPPGRDVGCPRPGPGRVPPVEGRRVQVRDGRTAGRSRHARSRGPARRLRRRGGADGARGHAGLADGGDACCWHLTAALLQVREGTALMRLEGRVAARVTAALWDRLLDLSPAFFRDFTSGDLGMRAMTFQGLRDQVSGVVMGALLSTVFLLPTFVLLFVYDVAMGWLGLAGGLAALAVTVTLGARQVPHHRRLVAAQRALAGVLLQLIGAAHKLRATGKEWTAFTRWARHYRERMRSAMNAGRPARASGRVHGRGAAAGHRRAVCRGRRNGVRHTVRGRASLTVYAAYMVFMSAITALGHSMSGVAAIVPAVEQVSPILEAAPKSIAGDAIVPRLRGGVRLDRVSFRYGRGRPSRAARCFHRCAARRVGCPGSAVPAPARAPCCASSSASRSRRPASCTTTVTISTASTVAP